MDFATLPDAEALSSLHRHFRLTVSVASIAEALVSFDRERAAAEVADYLRARDFDVVGVRVGGLVAGWADRETLNGGDCSEHTHLFEGPEVVDVDLPLAEVIPLLAGRERLFVRSLGVVNGIVTRADLQKPPVRMWLFGLVSVLEDAFLRILRRRYPQESWRRVLSPRRVQIAERLQAERRRRNESLDLAACLHFSDKADVLLRDPEIRDRLGFSSRTAARNAIRDVEQLRNQLAHAHDIVTSTLPTIVTIATHFDRILALARS